MVNLTELTVHQAQSSDTPNSARNANKRSNGVVAVRSKPRKRRAAPNREYNSNEQEENDEYQTVHRFKNGHLIMTLVAWAKKPSIEHDLSGILLKYCKSITENRNFIECALILQAAADLYARKVDLLFKSTMESQLRIVKSFNTINVKELHKIEKKMRKRKLTQIDDQQCTIKRRKRHKKWLNRPIFGEILDTMTRICKESASSSTAKEPLVHEIDPQSLKAMQIALTEAAKLGDPEFVKADMEQFKKDYEARFVPLEQYIYRPFVEKSQFVAYESADKEQVVQWESLLMSDHDVYHEKKFQWYEVFYNKKDRKTMMDITVWEDALYDHRKANLDALDFCDLLSNYDKFDSTGCEKFLMHHLQEEYNAQIAAETLKEKNTRLCPYQLDVHINQLSGDTLQSYLNNSENASQSPQNVTILVVSDAQNSAEDSEIFVLPTQTSTELSTDLSEINNTSNCLHNDSGFASGSEPFENNEIIERELSNLTPIQEVRKETIKFTIKLRARKLVQIDEDSEIEKSPKKKKRLKHDTNTTTCNLLDYERFFCENYNAGEKEGVVVPLPPLAVPDEDDLPNQDQDTAENDHQPQASKIPPLPTGEIITKEIRRFNAIQAEIAEDRERQRWYYDWESMIKRRLNDQHRDKFDIHEYGARIVNLFAADEPDQCLRFKDMVADQPRREVVRNFVAALHLATSMNVEVSGTSPGVLCNETLHLKLLNRELHHETLMGYEAPSEVKRGENKRRNAECLERQLKKKRKTDGNGSKNKEPIVLNSFISSAGLSNSLTEVQERLCVGRKNESRRCAQQSKNHMLYNNPRVVLERISLSPEQIATTNKYQQNIAQITSNNKQQQQNINQKTSVNKQRYQSVTQILLNDKEQQNIAQISSNNKQQQQNITQKTSNYKQRHQSITQILLNDKEQQNIAQVSSNNKQQQENIPEETSINKQQQNITQISSNNEHEQNIPQKTSNNKQQQQNITQKTSNNKQRHQSITQILLNDKGHLNIAQITSNNEHELNITQISSNNKQQQQNITQTTSNNKQQQQNITQTTSNNKQQQRTITQILSNNEHELNITQILSKNKQQQQNITQISSNNEHEQNIAQTGSPSPSKSVCFSKQSPEVRCTTTIVKTAQNLSFCSPMATSTPFSFRSSQRQSCDSGFYTDGSVTPGASPPSSAKVRRLTIEDSLLFDEFDITAGPSTDYTLNYPAVLDDVNTLIYRQEEGDKGRVICCRKRQLDFGAGDEVIDE